MDEQDFRPENPAEKTDITFFPELQAENLNENTAFGTIKGPEEAFLELQQGFHSGMTKSIDWRKQQLNNLKSLLEDNQAEILAALNLDNGTPINTEKNSEIDFVKTEIQKALKQTKKWANQKKYSLKYLLKLTKYYKKSTPQGVVLIIPSWNNPLLQTFLPLTGALAAGCTIMIQSNYQTPEYNKILETLVRRYFEPDAITVIEGKETPLRKILEPNFSHIFFTGNTKDSKIIAAKAMEKSITYTVETETKNPIWLDNSIALTEQVETITKINFPNNKQSIYSPDYLLIEETLLPDFLKLMQAELNSSDGTLSNMEIQDITKSAIVPVKNLKAGIDLMQKNGMANVLYALTKSKENSATLIENSPAKTILFNNLISEQTPLELVLNNFTSKKMFDIFSNKITLVSKIDRMNPKES